MTPLWVSLGFVLGIVVASFLWKRDVSKKGNLPRPDGGTVLPFSRARSVMTEGEANLYKQLTWCMGNDLIVVVKPRLLELVTVPKKSERREFYSNLARTRAADFALIDAKGTMPVMAIMCGNKDAQKRGDEDVDDVLEDILKSARIPFMYLSTNKVYPPSELKNLIRTTISQSLAAQDDAADQSANSVISQSLG